MKPRARTKVDVATIVSAAFARSSASVTIHEASADASAFAGLALSIRLAAVSGRPVSQSAVARARAIARKYSAVLCLPLDPLGAHVGLVFAPPVHRSGFSSMLFVC